MGFMECNKWQETGLLYLSQELRSTDVSEFQAHIDVCSVCRNEIDSFDHLQKNVLSADIFLDVPSELIDTKIIAACSKKPIVTGFSLFGVTWAKRALYSSLFLVFGLGAGLYFAMNYYIPEQNNTVAGTSHQLAPVAHQSQAPQTVAVSKKDSLTSHKKDSLTLPEDQPMLARPIDPNSHQGIITVDMSKE
jgi:hypothetical protein